LFQYCTLCAGVAVLSPLLAEGIREALPQLAPASVVPLISPDANKRQRAHRPPDRMPFRFGFAGASGNT